MSVTPMFPLGSVLVPGATLVLHVFEDRYKKLTERCLSTDEPFGVVIILRGHEVGGGDERGSVGCLATITSAEQAPDGRWGLLCMGTERIRVSEWLEDDPYPMAATQRWPDPPAAETEHSRNVADAATLRSLLRRTLAQATEAGASVAPATLELSADPAILSYQALGTGLIGSFDCYEILGQETAAQRLATVAELVTAASETIEFALRSGDEPKS